MIRRTLKNLGAALKIWWRHNPFENSAAITFYSLFSLAPILLIAVSIGGLVIGQQVAYSQLLGHIDEFIGPRVAGAINNLMANLEWQTGSLWGLTVGLVVLIVGATAMINQLKNSLNKFWLVISDPQWNSLLNFLITRGISLLIVAGLGLGVLLLVLSSTALSAIRSLFPAWIPTTPLLVSLGNNLLFLVTFALLWTLVMKLLPDVKIPWKNAAGGAILTSLLLWVGKVGIAYYLSMSRVTLIWGAAGASVLLLLWIYYSSMILLFGAAYTRASMDQSPEPWPVKAHAVRQEISLVPKD